MAIENKTKNVFVGDPNISSTSALSEKIDEYPESGTPHRRIIQEPLFVHTTVAKGKTPMTVSTIEPRMVTQIISSTAQNCVESPNHTTYQRQKIKSTDQICQTIHQMTVRKIARNNKRQPSIKTEK